MLCPCADQESIKNDQFRGHTRFGVFDDAGNPLDGLDEATGSVGDGAGLGKVPNHW